uniref:Uncharacterized protein n=1 Tax=Cereibacter sphaeroides (strain ATCC 17025 / ATH 2.4.3) TaxID=349102 RepID=A4WSF5_CERS5
MPPRVATDAVDAVGQHAGQQIRIRDGERAGRIKDDVFGRTGFHHVTAPDRPRCGAERHAEPAPPAEGPGPSGRGGGGNLRRRVDPRLARARGGGDPAPEEGHAVQGEHRPPLVEVWRARKYGLGVARACRIDRCEAAGEQKMVVGIHGIAS